MLLRLFFKYRIGEKFVFFGELHFFAPCVY